jgi:Histidine kinase-, DNA gyrase B-, and HSP90-like ATPase
MKKAAGSVDATPSKRLFRSIIADYDLRTGICELVDNAIDQWNDNKRSHVLKVGVSVRLDQQSIQVDDNAGGIAKDALKLLVMPGGATGSGEAETIGMFGVGSKRAVVALAERVEIRTRKGAGPTHLLEFDDAWLQDDEWELPIFEVDAIASRSTSVALSKLRFHVDDDDLRRLREHLETTYALFLNDERFTLKLNGATINPKTFEHWTYPPEYCPRRFRGTLESEEGQTIRFTALAGLSNEQGSIAGEYGVYFYCNDRLIARGLKTPEVGFVARLAGAPHNVVSLVRVIVFLNGPAECMPWNSSKSSIGTNHRTFKALQTWLQRTLTGFANVSKRFHGEWPERVFKYKTGEVVDVAIDDFEQVRKSFLPPLPVKREKYSVSIQKANERVLERKPWARGAVDTDLAVEVIQKQKLDQKNRIILILLDSSLEIAFKDFLVHESGHHYTDRELVTLFGARHTVESEVKKYVTLEASVWSKLKFYYGLRCKLVHERSSAGISDADIAEFRGVVQKVLSKLFKVRWGRRT